MKYRQLLLDFGRSVMRRVKMSPDAPDAPDAPAHRPAQRNRRLRPDPLLEDFANQLLAAAGFRALKVSVCWNPSLRTTAGLASWKDRQIILNPKLLEVSSAEVQRTLRHELAHLLAQFVAGRRRIEAHGREWREACEVLGIPNEPRCHNLPFKRHRPERKFFYSCPECGSLLARVRRPKRAIACIKCCRKFNGGRYSERFRFRPTTPPAGIAA